MSIFDPATNRDHAYTLDAWVRANGFFDDEDAPTVPSLKMISLQSIEPPSYEAPDWQESNCHSYAERMRTGAVFPPIVVFRIRQCGYSFRIYDGRHRFTAAKLVGCKEIAAYVPRWDAIADDMSFWDDICFYWPAVPGGYLNQLAALVA